MGGLLSGPQQVLMDGGVKTSRVVLVGKVFGCQTTFLHVPKSTVEMWARLDQKPNPNLLIPDI